MDDSERTEAAQSGRGAPIVKSAARAMRILGQLVRRPQGMSLTEIARALELDRATAHRLLRTLMGERVVAQDPDSRHYRFSPAAWLQLAPYLAGGRVLTDEAHRIVDELARRTGATCILSFVDETQRAMAPTMYSLSPRPLRFDPTGFSPAPAHAIGAGKCFLAYLPEEDLEEWLKGDLPRSTDRTITSPDQLRKELAQVRQQGYAVGRGEWLSGVFGVAVPVRDDTGRVFGGLALGTTQRELAQHLSTWLPLLRRGAEAISNLLARGLAAPPSRGA
jgi:IclR family acetate operon transcriptional repressor